MPGYNVKYGKNRALTFVKIIAAIPKILTRIKEENLWLHQFLIRERPDAVISDNRYGLYSKEVYSVFITHQLRISSPFGWIGDALLQWLNYRLIDRHSACWIPDLEADGGLAGKLSHPEKMPHTPTRYIGILSRFFGGGIAEAGETRSDLLILLSGPEPQRSLFERMILDQLAGYAGRAVLIRGLPEGGSPLTGLRGIEIHDHLAAGELEKVTKGAGLVLARAGYSTVMDLARLGKKAVLVPTPGQTEQEYLGEYLAGRKLAICMRQKDFSLDRALDAAKGYAFGEMAGMEEKEEGRLSAAVKDLISRAAPAI